MTQTTETTRNAGKLVKSLDYAIVSLMIAILLTLTYPMCRMMMGPQTEAQNAPVHYTPPAPPMLRSTAA